MENKPSETPAKKEELYNNMPIKEACGKIYEANKECLKMIHSYILQYKDDPEAADEIFCALDDCLCLIAAALEGDDDEMEEVDKVKSSV